MSAPFTLDTSGAVQLTDTKWVCLVAWSDLTPFAQGYVEALLRDFFEPSLPNISAKGFSDLSPEALATILADCEAVGDYGAEFFADDPGASFWLNRQRGWPAWADRRGRLVARFPPLTPYLADDGKIHLKAVAA